MQETTGTTKFVVGLGNPGRQYARSRHNVGFEVLADLARRWQPAGPRGAFSGQLYEARVSRDDRPQQRVLMLAPMTYMNRSGSAVREMAAFYKAPPQDILVVLDDVALPLGRLRARAGGSSGGHKGLGDVINALGSTAVPRLRLGVGAPPGQMETAEFVLAPFREEELPEVRKAVAQAACAVEDWVFNGILYVMERYNRRGEQPAEPQ